MKKILALLGSVGLVATSAMTVVACAGQTEQIINPHAEINNLANERIKSLILADQFGLDHNQTYNLLQQNETQVNSRYDELFNDESIEALGFNGTLGSDEGGILSKIIGDDFQITDEMILDVISQMAGADRDEIGQASGAKQIGIIINAIAGVSDFFFGQGLGSIMQLVSSFIPGLINADLINQVTNIRGQIDEVISAIPEETVKPLLASLKNGTDLTKFHYTNRTTDEELMFSVNQLSIAMGFSLVNFFGYGIEEDYQELDVIALSTPVNINYGIGASRLLDYIKTGKISEFNLMLNLEKTMENLMQVVTILNTILSLYRTPEINYSVDKDSSNNLFSETQTNDEFARELNAIRLDELEINLKGFNVGELIANVQYYFGGDEVSGQYHLQKLIYALLSAGSTSPLVNLIIEVVGQELGISGIAVIALRLILGQNLIQKIVNNTRITISTVLNNNLYWGIIGPLLGENANEIRTALIAIEEAIGDNSFGALYAGNLKPIIDLAQPILPEGTMDDINGYLDDIFGELTPNLGNLLHAVPVKQLLAMFGLPGFNNGNVPSFADHYLDLPIGALAEAFGTAFEIDPLATTAELVDFNFDFEVLEQVVIELLYAANNQETGIITQILDALDADDLERTLGNIYGILGYGDFSQGIVRADSFMGHLIKLLVPELDTIIDEDNQTFFVGNIGPRMHDHLTWVLRGLVKILPNLIQTTDISDFVQTIIGTQGVFTTSQTNVEFEGTSQLQASTMVVEFDPTVVVFENGRVLGSQRVRYEFVIERVGSASQFDFVSYTKTLI